MAAGRRVALVTGASRGIGRAIAQHLAAAGYGRAARSTEQVDTADQVRVHGQQGGGAPADRVDEIIADDRHTLRLR